MIRAFPLAAVLLLASCSKNIQTQEAVRQGVMDYMNSIAPKIGLDMSSMQVDVPAVSFDHEHARATVSVRPKAMNTGAMEMVYNLDRKGDKWVVHGGPTSMGVPHGQQAAPDGSQAAPEGTQLPPGHPSVGNAPGSTNGGQLPAGHPPVGSKQ